MNVKKFSLYPWFLAIPLVVLHTSGCSDRPSIPPSNFSDRVQTTIQDSTPIKSADLESFPWQVWSDTLRGYPLLDDGIRSERKGEFEKALEFYDQTSGASTAPPSIRFEALSRKLGLLLKMKRSKDVLREVKNYLDERSLPQIEIPPYLALLVGYAYSQSRDINQSLAWFSLANRRAGSAEKGVETNRIGERAELGVRLLVESLNESELQMQERNWQADQFISYCLRKYASVEVAGKDQTDELPPIDGAPAELSKKPTYAEPTIGVLLPMSGQYKAEAQNLWDGIREAGLELGEGASPRLVLADTAGDIEKAKLEFERLVNKEGATVIIGPLLASTTEAVVEVSEKLQVPFISFSKRKGVTELGDYVNRLGVTVPQQVEGIVQYLVAAENVRKIGLFYPRNPLGEELAAVFAERVGEGRAELASKQIYEAQDPMSKEQAVERMFGIEGSEPTDIDAVFIADGLDGARELLEAIRNRVGPGIVVAGPASWYDPATLSGMSQVYDGVIFVSPFNPFSNARHIQDFAQKYQQEFGREPDLFSAQGYDAAKFVFRCFDTKKKPIQDISRCLRSDRPVQGVTGLMKATGTGEINRRMSIVKFEQGSIIELRSPGKKRK